PEVDRSRRERWPSRADGRVRPRGCLPDQGCGRVRREDGGRSRRRAGEARETVIRLRTARDRRRRSDRVRAVLPQRSPLPPDLSARVPPLRPVRQALFPVEAWFGEQVTQQICRHHQRRLTRLGQRDALEPPAGGWAVGAAPPRSGNAIEILIDGAQALPAIAKALRSAKSHAHLTGWHFSPDFAL